MIARAYLALYAAYRRTLVVADVAFAGFWLGVLTRRSLHAVDEAMYRRSRLYRADAHNLRGLFPWEEAVVSEYFSGRPRLAVVGAGGGREVIALSRLGHEVLGYECNRALLETAQGLIEQTGCRARVEWLPRDTGPAAPPGFDGVVVGWSAYTLIIGRTHRVRFLRELRGVLEPGAPVLISFFTRSDGDPRPQWVARTAGGIRRVLRREAVEVGDDVAPNHVHRFVRAEIEAELAEAGFSLVAFEPQGGSRYDSGHAVGLAH